VTRHAYSSEAPRAVGPYSQAVEAGEVVYLSGRTPIDPATGTLVESDVAGQAERCFDDLAAVLAAAGLTLDDVVKVNVYRTTMGDFAALNEVYVRRFVEPYPRAPRSQSPACPSAP